jgi:hypothetical protein
MITPQELQTKINELQEQLDELKETKGEKPVPQCKRWRAKKNGMYWSVDSYGKVIEVNDGGLAYDNWQYKTGNYFQIKQEAQAYKDYLEAKYVIECDAGGYEWIFGEGNYCGMYNGEDKQVDIGGACMAYRPDNIYFEPIEAIEKSQQDHPEEWLTYLTYGMPRVG